MKGLLRNKSKYQRVKTETAARISNHINRVTWKTLPPDGEGFSLKLQTAAKSTFKEKAPPGIYLDSFEILSKLALISKVTGT